MNLDLSSALQLYDDVVTEATTLENVLETIGPLPREALFLGVSYEDWLPVLLNLWDAKAGGLLIIGDDGVGKTTFLKSIASASEIMHPSEQVQYAIITSNPEEWAGFDSGCCVGIFPSYADSAVDLISSLSGWANHNRNNKRSVILLIDDLSVMEKMDYDIILTFTWLARYGSSRGIWIIATTNGKMKRFENWMSLFDVTIFGDVNNTFKVTTKEEKHGHFVVKESNDWLDFWVPRIEK